MIYCLSCEKYPKDSKVIPFGSTFPINTFKVKLLSNALPSQLPTSGVDVEGLADNANFSVGSLLYVVDGNDGSEVYVFVDGGFELWDSPIGIEF